MFRAFNLIGNLGFSDPDAVLRAGDALKTEGKRRVRATLEAFLQNNKRLNGSAMQDDWFPQVTADVFISHARRDEKLALMLAGWLSGNLGLYPFVDSCVWGNSRKLIRMIDNEYCLNADMNTYNYDMRNGSTAHVYMMLATALARMIDKTECAIVLRSSNSITPEEAALKTKSPWLFMEIATMSVIRRRKSSRRVMKKADKSLGRIHKNMEIEYILDMRSMKTIDSNTLNEWCSICDKQGLRGSETLDVLYELVAE